MGGDASTTPTHLKAPHGAKNTEITWADGAKSVIPNTVLRGYCPCATCQGHGGVIEFVEGGDSRLRDLEMVGNYALKLVWGDGHHTGLYTFRYLRELSTRPEAQLLLPGEGRKRP
ncbi:MAG: DUF971 domain-containing protein [Myxococcota bacterium]